MLVVVDFTVDGYFSSLLFGTVTNNADVNTLIHLCKCTHTFLWCAHFSMAGVTPDSSWDMLKFRG